MKNSEPWWKQIIDITAKINSSVCNALQEQISGSKSYVDCTDKMLFGRNIMTITFMMLILFLFNTLQWCVIILYLSQQMIRENTEVNRSMS